MEEKKKRKRYTTTEQQVEFNKMYIEKYPEKKAVLNQSRYKSTCKRYIREFATMEELKEIEQLIKVRKQQLKNQ